MRGGGPVEGKLTDRQRNILQFLGKFSREKGYPPTVREIASFFGFSSLRGVQKHLAALQDKGMIRRQPGRSRAIEIVSMTPADSLRVPILGRIPAGPFDLALEDEEGAMEIDRSLARGEGLFFLKVTGNSMVGAHIVDGDYALIRWQSTAENGDIVAVRIGEEATLKRFYKEGRTVRLQPENPEMDPIFIREEEDLAIVGKVLAVVRSIR